MKHRMGHTPQITVASKFGVRRFDAIEYAKHLLDDSWGFFLVTFAEDRRRTPQLWYHLQEGADFGRLIDVLRRRIPELRS